MEALNDLPPIPKNQSSTTPLKTLEKIKQLALLHPSKGCKYLEHLLALQSTRVSSVTIQKHLDQAGLAKKYGRWLALEQPGAESPQKQTNELPSWKSVIRNLGKAMCSTLDQGNCLTKSPFIWVDSRALENCIESFAQPKYSNS